MNDFDYDSLESDDVAISKAFIPHTVTMYSVSTDNPDGSNAVKIFTYNNAIIR